MKWETRCYNPPPPLSLSSVAQRSLTCASSNINVMRQIVIAKKIKVCRTFLFTITSKLCNFTPSYTCNKCYCVGQCGVITKTFSSASIWLGRTFCMIYMLKLWIEGWRWRWCWFKIASQTGHLAFILGLLTISDYLIWESTDYRNYKALEVALLIRSSKFGSVWAHAVGSN